MSRPPNTKLLILFSTLTANYAKLDLELMMHVLFVMMNLRIYIPFSVNVLNPKRSGLISNRSGTIYRISQSIFLHKTFYLELYRNNALYQIY